MTQLQSTSMQHPTDNPVPTAAIWLGGTGAIPFVVCALAAAFGAPAWADFAAQALAFYGAIILSFLGGIQWGLAISGKPASEVSAIRLGISVVPSLIGWAALFLPIFSCLLVLTAAFALVLFQDVQVTARKEAPRWYPKLRIPLSAAVMVSLAIGAAGSV